MSTTALDTAAALDTALHYLGADLPPEVSDEAEPPELPAGTDDRTPQQMLDDWLARHPRYVPRDLAPEHERYRLFTVDELGQFPEVEWHDGLEGVLPKRELVGFYGKGDSYKSFLALDWACHLAAAGHAVVYIVAEGATGIQARVRAWMQHRGVEALPALRLMPSSVKMHDPHSVITFAGALEAQLDGEAPALLVVDTLARNFVGGNENAPQDMGMFVEGCEAVRRHFDCTVLVIHHTTKDGRGERGSESLRNASFAMYSFKRIGPLHEVDVACDRMKDARVPTTVRMHPVEVVLPSAKTSMVAGWPYAGTAPDEDTTVEPVHVPTTEDAEYEANIYAVLAGRDRGVSQTELEDAVPGRREKVREVAQRLAADPLSEVEVAHVGRGYRYRLVPKP